METTSKDRVHQQPVKKVRQTPTLAHVQAMLGDTPVGPYDAHFMRSEGTQARAFQRIVKIIDVSEGLLADPKVGLNGITTADVAAGAGMSIGTFYRYFEDIIALLDYIWPERIVTFKRIKASS